MPAQFHDEKLPPEELEALEKGKDYFLSFTSADPALQTALRDAARGEGKVWQVFTLLLPDVLYNGRGLKGADPGGWRVAARAGPQVIAGDIYTGNTVGRTHPYPLPAGAPRLACIRRGEEISEMLATIQSLYAPPLSNEIPAQSFNLHLLLLPGLVTDSLWLQPRNPAAGTSYIVPYNTLIEGLSVRKLYAEDEFIQIVRPVAEKWDEYNQRRMRSTTY